MRLRLVIVAVFVSAAAVPGLLAYGAGVLPVGSSPADGSGVASHEFRVTSLAWPERPLGLGAAGSVVVWEQRDDNAALAGLWAYDVRTQRAHRILGKRGTGIATGFPSVAGGTLVWATRPAAGGHGPLSVQGLDTQTGRRWTVAERGRNPSIGYNTIVWVERGRGAARGDDAVCGQNTLTDEEFTTAGEGRVLDVRAAGTCVVWLAESAGTTSLWQWSYRGHKPAVLATGAAAVAVNTRRVVWASATTPQSSTLSSWNRNNRRTMTLCTVPGAVSALFLGDGVATFVVTDASGDGDIWAYDFSRRAAVAVSPHGGRQANPVLVGGTVFWADRRSGQWELYGRSLQP